jgi:hypothetical protein
MSGSYDQPVRPLVTQLPPHRSGHDLMLIVPGDRRGVVGRAAAPGYVMRMTCCRCGYRAGSNKVAFLAATRAVNHGSVLDD